MSYVRVQRKWTTGRMLFSDSSGECVGRASFESDIEKWHLTLFGIVPGERNKILIYNNLAECALIAQRHIINQDHLLHKRSWIDITI